MNGTIGQMLTLTADIAETLLAIKDTDSSITPELIDKIEQLHTLAQLPVETVADVEEPELPAELSPKEEIQCEPIAEANRQAPPELEDTLELTEQEEDAVKETPEVPEPPETAETPEEAGLASVTSLSPATLREAMSLNDLFLYRRTLFGGSAAAFNDALTQIATFSHISEVRNFMRDTLHINMKTTEAKDFINVMAPFFSEF